MGGSVGYSACVLQPPCIRGVSAFEIKLTHSVSSIADFNLSYSFEQR